MVHGTVSSQPVAAVGVSQNALPQTGNNNSAEAGMLALGAVAGLGAMVLGKKKHSAE